MQEDKEPVFETDETLMLCLAAVTGMMRDLTAVPARMRAALGGSFPTATDLADWLVRTLGMPFRQAHHVTGRLVALAEAQGCPLDALDLAAMQTIEPKITEDVFTVLTPEASAASRTSFGGTAPARVREAAAAARERFL